MRNQALIALAAGSLMLGGCYGGGLGGLLGGGLYNDGYDNDRLSRFERNALSACGNRAQRSGDVRIRSVRQTDRDFVEVRGSVRDRQGDRNFLCVYRSDGRIVDFRI